MITQFFIDMMSGIITGITSVIPSWSVSTTTINQAQSAGVSAGSLNGWFPETFLFACLAVVLAVRVFFLAWNGVQWLYGLIPFNG